MFVTVIKLLMHRIVIFFVLYFYTLDIITRREDYKNMIIKTFLLTTEQIFKSLGSKERKHSLILIETSKKRRLSV